MTEQETKAAAEPPLDCRVGLPKKLRDYVNDNGDWAAGLLPSDVLEAADEIERLRAAIAWALGEGPDGDGKQFEPDKDEPRRPDGQPIARYWWRGNLRRMTTPNAPGNKPPLRAND